MNPNIEYEKLVGEIHQAMLKYEGAENLIVEHDVKIEGKSGATHQIDLFWEFKLAGVKYRTCVECKNYKSPVKKSHVAAFSAILEDIGNSNGIIATTENFQKGAKLFAKEKNIRLILVNYLINTINITSSPKFLDYKNWSFEFNKDFVKEILDKNNLDSYTFNFIFQPHDAIYDKNGNEVETFESFLKQHKSKKGENRIETSSELYISTELGLIPFTALSYDMVYVDLPSFSSTIQINSGSKAVLQDIVNNNIHYLNDDGTMTKEKALKIKT